MTDSTTPASLAAGSPASSYPLSGIDTYSAFTGKVGVVAPIRHIGGRGSAGYDMLVRIADQWSVTKTYTANPQAPYSLSGGLYSWQTWDAGYGPGTVFARSSNVTVNFCPNGNTTPQFTLSRLTFTAPDGSETELRDSNTDDMPYRVPNYCNTTSMSSWNAGRGLVYTSRDGSGLVFRADSTIYDYFVPAGTGANVFGVSGYLHLPDGTTYRVDNSSISWIRDRNGNKIQFSYDANHQVTQIVDQNGRTTTVTYAGTSCHGTPASVCDVISYRGWQGQQSH